MDFRPWATRPAYKSRAERKIAEALTGHRIAFIYEKPTAVMDGGKVKIWYPDFSLRDGVLIEYFGINGKADYLARCRHKLSVYATNQLDAISLYPPDMTPGWQSRLMDRVHLLLERRLEKYRELRASPRYG